MGDPGMIWKASNKHNNCNIHNKYWHHNNHDSINNDNNVRCKHHNVNRH